MRDAFFLGSGVSLGTAPGTGELTTVALGDLQAYQLGTDERWRGVKLGAGASLRSAERRERVVRVIAALRLDIDAFYANRPEPAGCRVRETNYEDLGFAADALAGVLSGERDDPSLEPMVDRVADKTAIKRSDLREAAEDTVSFLRDLVHLSLADLVPKAGHLQPLVDAVRQGSDPLPIYTLNHDCLIERVLQRHGLPYDDLLRVSDDRLVLEPLAPPRSDAKACIYKLHGSVNWRRFRRMDGAGGWFTSWVGDACSPSGIPHHQGTIWRSDDRALFLLGRFNKELGYLDQPFLDLIGAFTRSLRSRQRLFVSGYGFGDKAVNTMLIEWIYSAPGKRLVVLHQDEQGLVDRARGAITQRWHQWKNDGILTVVPTFLGDCSWDEIKTVA